MWPTHIFDSSQDTLGCGTFSKSTNDIPQYLVLLTLRVVDYPSGVSPFVNPCISLLFYESIGLLPSQDKFNNVVSCSQKVMLDPSLLSSRGIDSESNRDRWWVVPRSRYPG